MSTKRLLRWCFFKSIREEGDLIIIKISDKRKLDLRKWSLFDEKGLTTTVTIFNVKQGVRVAEGTFTIDYAANRENNTSTKSR